MNSGQSTQAVAITALSFEWGQPLINPVLQHCPLFEGLDRNLKNYRWAPCWGTCFMASQPCELPAEYLLFGIILRCAAQPPQSHKDRKFPYAISNPLILLVQLSFGNGEVFHSPASHCALNCRCQVLPAKLVHELLTLQSESFQSQEQWYNGLQSCIALWQCLGGDSSTGLSSWYLDL